MCDFLDDIGEGAYYLDNEEDRIDNNRHPTDALIEELEKVD